MAIIKVDIIFDRVLNANVEVIECGLELGKLELVLADELDGTAVGVYGDGLNHGAGRRVVGVDVARRNIVHADVQ